MTTELRRVEQASFHSEVGVFIIYSSVRGDDRASKFRKKQFSIPGRWLAAWTSRSLRWFRCRPSGYPCDPAFPSRRCRNRYSASLARTALPGSGNNFGSTRERWVECAHAPSGQDLLPRKLAAEKEELTGCWGTNPKDTSLCFAGLPSALRRCENFGT